MEKNTMDWVYLNGMIIKITLFGIVKVKKNYKKYKKIKKKLKNLLKIYF
jgi:Zn-dependent membrane protease YugP